MKRHAYLIMAHHRFDMLARLIAALDSENADFYIHIDWRARDVDEQALLGAMRHSHGQIDRRYRITWGGDTQIRCEMMLLRKAVAKGYDYYHLLSGVDIPLRTGAQIERFFETRTESFVEFKQGAGDVHERVCYHHPLQNLIGRPRKDAGLRYGLYSQIAYECIKLQRALGVDRTRSAPFAYSRGGNWFSIAHDLAAHVVENERTVRRYFYRTLNGDEMFLQCLASGFAPRGAVVNDNLRMIDWQRTEQDGCSPHTFTMADRDALLASDKLFARKFDPAVDAEIIELLYRRIEQAQKN